MKRALCIVGVATALVGIGASPALAANGNTNRPAGQVYPVAPSDNGGDNGWGNCGHNSSGGNPHSDPDGGGNGGYKKGDDCGPPVVTPGDGGGTPPSDGGGVIIAV